VVLDLRYRDVDHIHHTSRSDRITNGTYAHEKV
jgi:hypothetical protein